MPDENAAVLAHRGKILMDRAIEHGKRMVEKQASSYGWSDWVKVEVERHLTENMKN